MNQIDKDVPTKNPIPDVSDSKSCANYCLSNPNCNLYEYDMRNKQCTLFRDGEIKIGGKTQKEKESVCGQRYSFNVLNPYNYRFILHMIRSIMMAYHILSDIVCTSIICSFIII